MENSAKIPQGLEELLETIYRLEELKGKARTGEIASTLGVTRGTVTTLLARLERKGLVVRRPYKGVKLSPEGRALAAGVLRRHRLSEMFLSKMLNMPWSKVHSHACKLEHALDDEVLDALERTLKRPKKCPHGNPIPNKSGKLLKDRSIPLSKAEVGFKGKVVKVVDEKEEFLERLASVGLIPGAPLKVDHLEAQRVVLSLGSFKLTLSRSEASGIYVEEVELG